MRLEPFHHNLAHVLALLSQATGDRLEFEPIPDSDPAECGLLIRHATSSTVGGDVETKPELRKPIRIYISGATLSRALRSAPESLALAMELFDVDRLVVFGLPRNGTKRAIDVGSMIDQLRELGFRSPRLSLDCALHQALIPVAMSLIYVKAALV